MTLNNKSRSIFLERMSSICTDQSTLRAKFAKISLFASPTSRLFDKTLVIIEYLQLLGPSLFFALSLKDSQETSISRSFLFISRIINPGWWISFDNLGVFEMATLSGVFFMTLLKYSLAFYILYRLSHREEPSSLLAKFWSLLFKLQTRALYLYMTCCWTNVLISWPWDAGNSSKGMAILSIVGLFLEFGLSMLLSVFCYYIFPTKSFLAAKDNIIEIVNLVQKAMVQILAVLLDLNSQTTTWVVFLVSLAFDLCRNMYFFRTLPLYNFKALQYQSLLLVAVTSLNLSCFVLNIMKSANDDTNSLKFLVFLWILIFLMTNSLSRQWLRKMFWNVIFDCSLKNPGLLVHRISAIKQLRKLTIPGFEHNQKYVWNLLVNKCLDKKNLDKILKLNGSQPPSEMELNINHKPSANWMFKKYLESLKNQFPENEFIRLYFARFNVNKFRIYGESLKLVTSLKNNDRYRYKLQSELVLMEIQNHIQQANLASSQDRQLNPEAFIQEQFFLAKLKMTMLEQARLHRKICQELKKESPKTAFISIQSQALHKIRKSVLSQFRHFENNHGGGNLEPLLLFAHYSLSLNHSQEEYEHYIRLHTQLLSRNQKYFDQEGLSQKNVFQENLGFFFVSGDKADAGNIIFGSKGMGFKSVADLNMLFGTNLANRAAPCLRGIYANFYKMFAENGQTAYFDKLSRGCMYNQDGYLVEVDFYFSIHPIVTQGFYFTVIFRPVESNRDSIFILENGDIDCATKNIAERFDLLLGSEKEKLLKNIKDICPELVRVNQAFNMVAFPEKYTIKDLLSMDQAREIHNLFTTTGKDLQLSPCASDDDPDSKEFYSYNCKMTMRIFGPLVVKILTVEENETRRSINSRKPALKIERKMQATEYSEHMNFETLNNTLKFAATTTQTPLTKKGTFFETQTQTQRDQDNNSTSRGLLEPDILQEEQRVEKKMADIYKQSLEKKYSPKSFKTLCGLAYLTILFFLVIQIVLSIAVNNSAPDLKSKKDALRNFQLRNFLLISLEGTIRRIYNIKAGIEHTSAYILNIYTSTANDLLATLDDANQELLISSEVLEESINDLLFENSLPIYYTDFNENNQISRKFNSLDAVSQVIESSLKVVFNNRTEEIKEKADFVIRNALNDLLVRNQFLSRTVKSFLDNQREDLQNVLMRSQIVFLVTLSLTILVFISLIWKHYMKEKINLSALCRLSNTKIEQVIQCCMIFEETVEDFINPISSETSSLLLRANQRKLRKVDLNKKEAAKTPNSKQLDRKYVLHILKYILLIGVLIGLRFMTSNFSGNILNIFKEEQGRIYFIDYMKTRIVLSYQTYREILSTNDTTFIENRKLSTELKLLLEELKDIRENAYSYLLNTETAAQTAQIKAILFEDACKYVATAQSVLYCQGLKESGKETGLIYLLSSFTDLLGSNLLAYESSNKTNETLRDFENKLYGSGVPIYAAIVGSCASFSDLMNEHLEHEVEENVWRRNQALVISLLIAILVGCLMWVLILKKLRESVNEMKNVVRVLPPNMIFSSFILKKFLVKTARNNRVGGGEKVRW